VAAIPEMDFTEPERAFLRRFCLERHYLKYGDRPTENQSPGHFNDLSDLAHASAIAPDVLASHYNEGIVDPAPPEAHFPWKSLEYLAQRARQARTAIAEKFSFLLNSEHI
jgi:hypothetical protein